LLLIFGERSNMYYSFLTSQEENFRIRYAVPLKKRYHEVFLVIYCLIVGINTTVTLSDSELTTFLNERDSVTRFFFSGFLLTTSPGPNRHVQEGFRIFSNIRGVIRIRNRLPSDEYTRKSIRTLG
jgi:hypothetical protein